MRKYSDHILEVFKKRVYCLDDEKKIIVDLYSVNFEFCLLNYDEDDER